MYTPPVYSAFDFGPPKRPASSYVAPPYYIFDFGTVAISTFSPWRFFL